MRLSVQPLEHLLKWLASLDVRLKSKIKWIFRGKLREVVVGCFDVVVEHLSNIIAQALLSWTLYKHRNMVKLLSGITPQGSSCTCLILEKKG